MKIEYRSNNSGGSWWLTDEDWHKLEAAGWEVEWIKDGKHIIDCPDGRFLGALATSATKEFPGQEEMATLFAIKEWEDITGQHAHDQGCPCCGQPHYFSKAWED